MLSVKSSFLPNSDPLHQSDTSKAPGFRPPLQRPAPSPSGKSLACVRTIIIQFILVFFKQVEFILSALSNLVTVWQLMGLIE